VIAIRAASMIHFVTVAGLFHWQYSIHILCRMQTKNVLCINLARKYIHLCYTILTLLPISPLKPLFYRSNLILYYFYNFDKLISALTTTMYDVMHTYFCIIYRRAPNPMDPKS
jgi:hypothetical protein